MVLSTQQRNLLSQRPLEILQEFEEVNRLVTLSGTLTGPAKPRLFQFIADKEWKDLRNKRQENIQYLHQAIQNTKGNWSKPVFLQELAGKTNDFVLEYLDRVLSDDPETFTQLKEDLRTISSYPPVEKTLRGICGPTFLVSYVRSLQNNSYVLKWTDSREVACNEVYSKFATGFKKGRGQYPDEFFFVPEVTAAIDLAGKRMIAPTGITPIEEKVATQFASVLGSIIQNYHPQPKLEASVNPVVVRLEKVQGQNLPDFLQTGYASLSEETKGSLFRRLGRLAYLDFILGHSDRLVSFDPETRSFGEYEANIDNIMVSAKKGIALFAIDNGIIGSSPKYPEFLTQVLSSPQFANQLSEKVSEAIQNRMLEVKNADLFKTDLQSFGTQQIASGIQKMDTIMTQQLGPAFLASPSLSPIESIEPGLTSSLQERVKSAFQGAAQRNASAPHPRILSESRVAECATPTTVLTILGNIYNHCNGTPEDQLFFSNASVPFRDDNPKIESLFDLFHEIKRKGMNTEKTAMLRQRLEEFFSKECNISLGNSPVVPIGPAPTPVFEGCFSSVQNKRASPTGQGFHFRQKTEEETWYERRPSSYPNGPSQTPISMGSFSVDLRESPDIPPGDPLSPFAPPANLPRPQSRPPHSGPSAEH